VQVNSIRHPLSDGVAPGGLGVATKVRQAADFVRKKVREAYGQGEPPDDKSDDGQGDKAA
jgi:hypothetical protein